MHIDPTGNQHLTFFLNHPKITKIEVKISNAALRKFGTQIFVFFDVILTSTLVRSQKCIHISSGSIFQKVMSKKLQF